MGPRLNTATAPSAPKSGRRLSIWYGVLIFILAVFVARLFYLQIIRHDYYRSQALSDQLKEYAVPAERGIISARSGSEIVPLVLNEKLYTLFADPVFIKNASDTAKKVAAVTSASAADYEKLMQTKDSRYVVLTRRLSEDQK